MIDLSALRSFVHYQQQMLQFHLGLTTHHPYQSKPWTWLVMSRPVSYFCTRDGVDPAEVEGVLEADARRRKMQHELRITGSVKATG